MMRSAIRAIREWLAGGNDVSREQVLGLLDRCTGPTDDLLELTDELRQQAFGDRVRKCSDGFTSNTCSAGCKYCYLSPKNRPQLPPGVGVPRALRSVEEFVEDAKAKEHRGATQYKIVGPEDHLPGKQYELALAAFKAIKQETNLGLCASVGNVSFEQLRALRNAGVEYFNHSLETTRERYEKLGCCLSYDSRIEQNMRAKEAGLKRCSGMMIGMGESMQERVDVALLLRDAVGVESMPLNIFVPPRADQTPEISPEEALLTLALLRIIMPRTHIIANNGNLYFGKLFNRAVEAGASGIGLKEGNYLSHARSPTEVPAPSVR